MPEPDAVRPRVRLLACDMDGTLFRQDLRISARVREAIAEAQRQGVLVVLATGRMPAAAREFVELLGLTGPQIFANGSLVRTVGGEVLFHLPVEAAVARRVVEIARAREMHVNVYVGDEIYVQRLTPEAEFTHQLNRILPTVVPDLAAFVATAPTKLVIVRLPVVEPGLVPELQETFRGQLLVSSSVPQYCEMVNHLVDKGAALARLAQALDLATDQVAAIGDGDNDLTLLCAAGLPIAMGNATPGLKALATHVVGTVEEDGVAEAIERYILPGPG
jgi:Cof subfamily protein (haloacid dehalogenase superfamily)